MDQMKRLTILFLFITAAGCHYSSASDPLVAIQIQDRNGLTETISTPERLEIYNQVDFLASQPYKKILRVYKKKGKTRSKITTYHPNGTPWQYLEAEELRAHGAYREWHPNGQLKIEAELIGGTADVSTGAQHDWIFDGLSQMWDEQGNLLAKIPYLQGVLDGVSVYFYSTGQIERELPYHQDLLEGMATEYHPKGAIRSNTNYHQGIKQGSSVGYFQK